jgi:hypothetical protein
LYIFVVDLGKVGCFYPGTPFVSNCSPFRSIRVHPRFFSAVRVTRSLVLCGCFIDRCLSLCTFSYEVALYIFVVDLGKVGCFYPGTPFVSTNTNDCHDLPEI